MILRLLMNYFNLFIKCYGDHRDLHSFPTRRSSDLARPVEREDRLLLVAFAERLPLLERLRALLRAPRRLRSEEHTSELQSHVNLVCRLLLEKKKIQLILLSLMNSFNLNTNFSSHIF